MQQLIYCKAKRSLKRHLFPIEKRKAIGYCIGREPFGSHMKQIKHGMILSSGQSLRQENPFDLDSWNILFGAALI